MLGPGARWRVGTVAASAAVLVLGCGGGANDEPPASAAQARSKPAVVNAEGPGPAIRLPGGPQPKHLVIIDLKAGQGPEAGIGDEVTLRYVGARWRGGLQSNSWAYPQAPSFKLGTIALAERGLDEGIRGMRVGGRRKVIIPGYRRYYPGVAEERLDEAAVYIVDLEKVD